VKYASIGPIAVHLPQRVETLDQLQRENPRWNLELIGQKTGIRQRHIAAEGECASDLAVAAAQRLFTEHDVDPISIDFLLLCTQSPDYPLPSTACLLQDRLGLSTHCGALDYNLGCSGFVYGLALADGLIRTGAVQRVLLITAETYTKYIAPDDRALRPIFGDGAAATLVAAADEPTLRGFTFLTDGAAADTLFVGDGGARGPDGPLQPRKRKRWSSRMYMDGDALSAITTQTIPKLIQEVLLRAEIQRDAIEMFLMHQATSAMLERLRNFAKIEPRQMPEELEHCGNTVSSTIPVLINRLRAGGKLKPGCETLMVGFGIGYSAAGCAWRETHAD
jgi:3-oxoacyl-[acyl-carrier-protein] synthase-3